MAIESSLVPAKLNRPRLPRNTIRRDPLLARLQAGTEQPVTLVSAPAGYGKTTLVALWLSTLEAPCAWLSLDEFDDTLPGFVAYLCDAIASVAPDVGNNTRSVVEAPTQPSPERLADIILGDLARISTPLYLVLDDYHTLHTPEIHRLIERVVERVPENVHIILIARADPPLRLTRLRGRGQLVEVRSVHLRFSEEEASTFIEQLIGSQVSPEIVELLTERTEGWPVGLQLAAISLREQTDQSTFATAFARSTNHLVAEYLVNEVLQEMPEVQKAFLLECSILDRLCASLCDVVVGANREQTRAGQMIEALSRRNLFLIALDDEGRWYRFHHLFRSLLHHELEQTRAKAEIALLHERASRWFEAQGYVEEAVRHCLAAGDELRAAQLVERNVHPALNREEWRRLEYWLALLPDTVKQRPALLVAQAWLEQFRYRFAAIAPLVATARRNLVRDPDDAVVEDAELTADIYTLSAIAATVTGTLEETYQASLLALELLPRHMAYVRGIAEHYHARAIMQLGDLAGAVHKINQWLIDETQPDARNLRLLLALCAMYFDYGDMAALESAASMYRRVAQRGRNRLSIAWANTALGWAHYQQNNLANAVSHFTKVIDGRDAAHSRAVVESYSGLALAFSAQNEREQARATVEALAAWLTEYGIVGLLPFADAVLALCDLVVGITPPVHSMTIMESANLSGLDLGIMPVLVYTQLWLRDPSPDNLARVEVTLSKCRAAAAARNYRRRLIEIDALDALRCAALGQQEEAITLLAGSVTRAENGGALRLLLDLGPGLHPLLQELHARGIAPEFIRRLLASYPEVSEPPPRLLPATTTAARTMPAGMQLTNRELDVLFLLAERLTNKEIASSLTLTQRTVKKHTINIYQKLHVDNRRAAVSEARTRGILPFP